MDEKNLWIQLKQGDKTAFEYIYRTYARVLFRYGKLYTQSNTIIEDAIQDLFIYIWNNKSQLSDLVNLEPYLHIALRNRIFKQLNKEFVYADFEDEVLAGSLIYQDDFSLDSTDELSKQIKVLYDKLPVRQKEVIHYRFICGMSIAEIGVLMNMNAQSVQNLLQRALKKSASIINARDLYAVACILMLS